MLKKTDQRLDAPEISIPFSCTLKQSIQYILTDKHAGGDLYKQLRHQNKTYRKRYGSAHNRHGIPNRTGIEERPDIVNTRARVGDWKADTMIGKNHKGVFVTLDERKSKLRLALPVSCKKAREVTAAIRSLFEPLKHFEKPSPSTMEKNLHSMTSLLRHCAVTPILPHLIIHGSEARMKMPMDCCDSIFLNQWS